MAIDFNAADKYLNKTEMKMTTKELCLYVRINDMLCLLKITELKPTSLPERPRTPHQPCDPLECLEDDCHSDSTESRYC